MRRDRILWPVFEFMSKLDNTFPRQVEQVARRIGSRTRRRLESLFEHAPLIRYSFDRWGAEKLEQLRNYVDGIISRDVQ